MEPDQQLLIAQALRKKAPMYAPQALDEGDDAYGDIQPAELMTGPSDQEIAQKQAAIDAVEMGDRNINSAMTHNQPGAFTGNYYARRQALEDQMNALRRMVARGD